MITSSMHRILMSVAMLIVILCSGCFEIIEEVNLKKDGSGSFTYTLNFSKSKLQLKALLEQDTVNGYDIPSKETITSFLIKNENVLQNQPGIHNVVLKQNWKDYIFSVTGEFDHVDALNKAVNNINIAINKGLDYAPIIADNFKHDGNTFVRLYDYDLISGYKTMNTRDKIIFNDAYYTTIYRFEKHIEECSNESSRVSKSGNAVMIKHPVIKILNNKESIKNSIKLK